MKRLFVSIMVMGIVMNFNMMAFAGIPEAIDDFMKNHPVKAGILYDVKEEEYIETIGASIVEDIKGVKNLDLDLLISSYSSETQSDDEKAFGIGLSYNYDLTQNFGVCAGVGGLIERFEKLDTHKTGEIKGGIYLLISGKF